MCGIATIFSYHESAPKVDPDELRSIRDAMTVRGPDSSGEWFSEDRRIGMGHRRLSIIDLSEKGAQPMKSKDGSLVVSFNGEIYNYKELRRDLENKGYCFQSQSDTEVLIHLYAEQGESMFDELRGMFAFVLWDAHKKAILLARDPYGIKPLYYADDGRTIRIASQVKALLTSGNVSKAQDAGGIVGFFLTGSVPEPFTIYRQIRQVPAGSILWIDSKGLLSPRPYASIAQIFRDALRNQRQFSSGQKPFQDPPLTIVREALLDSLRYHFVSDVPVGVFLSAGIDSGTLLGFAHDLQAENLQTVTLAFEEFLRKQDNEAPLAEALANRYQTKHRTCLLSQREFQTELPRVFDAMDQPSIDGINTYFVSKAASEMGLKVVLSGLGGDELFGGYPSFRDVPRMVRALAIPSRIPFSGDLFRHLYSSFAPLLSSLCSKPLGLSPKLSGLFKFGGTYAGAYFLRRGLFMPWELETILGEEITREGLTRLDLLGQIQSTIQPDPENSFARVASLEASLYMRNQLLRDADWAGMAHSLEIRVPYVDVKLLQKLAPFVGSHFNPFNRKNLLASCPATPLPAKVLKRAKTGFSVPLQEWLETDHKLDSWRQIPDLAKGGCHWSRRWAYVVFDAFQNN